MNDTNDAHDHEHRRPSPDEVEYPPILRLTSVSHDEHREASRERVRRAADGETVASVRNFNDPSDLRQLLTDRRVEMVRSIMDDPPESMKALADRLGRGTRQVHDDVHLLEDYGIVHLIPGTGRARKPVVPYERIKVEIEIGTSEIDGQSTGAQPAN